MGEKDKSKFKKVFWRKERRGKEKGRKKMILIQFKINFDARAEFF